jgi:hypothetical protein
VSFVREHQSAGAGVGISVPEACGDERILGLGEVGLRTPSSSPGERDDSGCEALAICAEILPSIVLLLAIPAASSVRHP